MSANSRHVRWYHSNLKKHRAQGRERYRKEVAVSRERMHRKGRRAQSKKMRFISRYKSSRPCADCGLSFPHYVLDFDHVRGIKKFELNRGFTHSFMDLQEEMEKCDVVCANCHRIRTWRRALAVNVFGAPRNYMEYVDSMPEGV